MKEEGFINSQGFSLGYCIEGDGANTLVIGSSIYYPRLFSENLRNHLRLVFADMRAFAPVPSKELSLDFGVDLLVQDIENIRQHLNLGKVIIVGHSGNVYLALEYAKRFPEHVSHVVLIGAGPNMSLRSKEAADKYWLEGASLERKKVLQTSLEQHPDSEYEKIEPNKRFIWNYLRHGARIWYDYTFDSAFLWDKVNVNISIFEYVWGTLYRDIDITQGLSSLNKPVFLALGSYDFIVSPPNSWDPLKPLFKDLTIQIFEKSGHSPFYEESVLFDDKLLKWLSSKE